MSKGFNLRAIFSADTKDIEAGSTRATESVKKFEKNSKSALDAFIGQTKVAGANLKTFAGNIGQLAIRFAAAAVSVKSFVSAVKTMAEFEKANSALAAVLGTTASKIGRLTESAIELGRKTEYTATQVTELQTELAKLGFSEPQIISMQESVLKFAAAVGTDLASAAARAGATMRGFGLTADETGDLLAVMAVSTSKSALSFDYLDETLGKVIPVTKAFGIDARGTTALLGAMANAGIDASSAGTALRRIMAELSNSGSKLNQTLGRQPKTMEDVVAALQELRDRGIGVTEAFDLVGKYAGATFLALVNGSDDVATLYGELQNVDSALNDMYETMTDNVEGAVNQLKSAWEGFILSMRQSNGVIKTVILALRDLVSEVNYSLFKETRNSTEKSRYTDILQRSMEQSADPLVALDRAYENLSSELSGKLSQLENRSWFAKATDKETMKAAKAEVEGLAAAYQELREQLTSGVGASPTPDIVPPTTTPSGGGASKKTTSKTGIFDAETLAEIEEMKMLREESEDMARRAKEAWDSLEHAPDPAIAAMMQFAHVNLIAFEETEQAAEEAADATISRLQEIFDQMDAYSQKMEDFSDNMTRIFQGAFIDSISNLGTALGEALGDSESAASNLSSALLGTFADMAIQLGELAISFGATEAAIQASLDSLNPYLAIAAGAALVMLGSAIKGATANIAHGGSYSASSISSSYGAATYGNNYQARDITVNVQGRLIGEGSNLIAVIDNTNKKRNLTT